MRDYKHLAFVVKKLENPALGLSATPTHLFMHKRNQKDNWKKTTGPLNGGTTHRLHAAVHTDCSHLYTQCSNGLSVPEGTLVLFHYDHPCFFPPEEWARQREAETKEPHTGLATCSLRETHASVLKSH